MLAARELHSTFGAAGHPFTLVKTFFAGDPVVVLREDDDDLYKLLLAVARDDAE